MGYMGCFRLSSYIIYLIIFYMRLDSIITHIAHIESGSATHRAADLGGGRAKVIGGSNRTANTTFAKLQFVI